MLSSVCMLVVVSNSDREREGTPTSTRLAEGVWWVMQDHRVEKARYLSCQRMSKGTFPAGVAIPNQYGTTGELQADVDDVQLSEGTLMTGVQQATLRLMVGHIAYLLIASWEQRGDEMAMRAGANGTSYTSTIVGSSPI